ncbi:MAG: L-threonylcarbamoyladenylate synthase [Planctomycetota bacterium]
MSDARGGGAKPAAAAEASAAGTAAPIAPAARCLAAGGVVAFPTETVYGLGADASNAAAVERIFALKGRPADHPLIVHIPAAEELPRWVREMPPAAERLAAAFWPGPLTLILHRAAHVLDAVTGGQDTVGVRVPGHPVALELLRAFAAARRGGAESGTVGTGSEALPAGIAAPSANRFGRVSPTTAAHVREEFPGQGPSQTPDMILDGGACEVGVESTIVDLTQAVPTILRPGGVTREALEAVLHAPVRLRGENLAVHATGAAATTNRAAAVAANGAAAQPEVRAPGMLESHYAPLAEVYATAAGDLPARVALLQREGVQFLVLARRSDVQRAEACGAPGAIPCNTLFQALPEEDAEFARQLYRLLREADARGFEAVVIVPPAAQGLGLAILDRITRAAGG